MADDPGAVESRLSQVRERLGGTMEEVGHRANVPARAKEAVNRGAERVRSTGSTVADEGGLSGAVKPLAIALGSIAAGFLVGSAIPSTSVEQEKLGPMSEDVKDVAKSTMQEAVERGKDVAGEAMEVARNRASEEGKQLGTQAADGVQQAAQQHTSA